MNGLILDMHPVAFVGKGQVVAGCIDAECHRHGQQRSRKQPEGAFHRIFHKNASLLQNGLRFGYDGTDRKISVSGSQQNSSSRVPFSCEKRSRISLLPSLFRSVISMPR